MAQGGKVGNSIKSILVQTPLVRPHVHCGTGGVLMPKWCLVCSGATGDAAALGAAQALMPSPDWHVLGTPLFNLALDLARAQTAVQVHHCGPTPAVGSALDSSLPQHFAS